MLSPYRVLDLADDRGIFCGKILADLGADVIKVEPPWGDPSRRIAPFYQDDPHPDKSVFWLAYGNNRRGITLNVDKPEGRDLLRRLVPTTHFLVESFRPGYLSELGLGYSQLKKLNPSLVMVSISPFGQDGPYSHYQATDLVGTALAGLLYITGDEDRPPVRVGVPQFWVTGAAAAAAGAMVAHHYRLLTGRGQHVDASCQQAVARTLSHAPQIWDLNRVNLKRRGPLRPVGNAAMRINWECKDGFVNFIQPGGFTGARSMATLSKWMDEEGYGDAVLRDTPWEKIGFGGLTQAVLDQMTPPIQRFFKTKSKAELAQAAFSRRILLFPVHDPKDIFEYPQLQARGFFQPMKSNIDGRSGPSFVYPGPFVRASEKPLTLRWPAPRLGEHNQEVYEGELGLTVGELEELKEAGVI